MFRLILSLILLSFFSSLAFCQKKVETIDHPALSQEWEFKMISAGDNKPNFQTTEDSIHFVPILLGEGYSLDQIKAHFNWTAQDVNDKMGQLSNSEFVVLNYREEYVPNVMILPVEEGEKIRKQILPIAKQIADSIALQIDSIVYKTKQVECLEDFQFEEVSLLILSNVLLDNGQIRNVEQEYLKAERPIRHEKSYYASYLGKPVDSKIESFGIYGNQVSMQDGFAIGMYGNQRQLPEVIRIKEKLKFQYQDSLKRRSISHPVITNKCNNNILKIANYFKPSLLSIIESNDELLRDMYTKSRYAKEVTYEEYFIWLYHILYSEATENLIEQGAIKIPEEKVSFYVLQM